MEIWKDIDGYNGFYQISNQGNVRSFYTSPKYDYKQFNSSGRSTTPHLVKPRKKDTGYLQVDLSLNGKSRKFYVHRLVATYFLDNPDNLEQVNHKDFNKSNNSVENLEWCTRKENVRHYTKSQFFKETYEKKGNRLAFRLANKIVKYKKEIITRRKKQESIQQIADELSLGRDFVSIVCYIFEI